MKDATGEPLPPGPIPAAGTLTAATAAIPRRLRMMKANTPSDPMLADVRRQPAVLRGLLDRRADLVSFGRTHLRPSGAGRLYAYGSGDGWFAARASAADSSNATPLRPCACLDFLLHVAPALSAEDRVLAITMSGNVDRSLEAAEAAMRVGPIVALLTDAGGGRVGALGMPRLCLSLEDIGPFLCGTSSYTASVTALLLALEDDAFAEDLSLALPDLESFIELAHARLGELAKRVSAPGGIRLLGAGRSVVTAEYGAAKFVELTTIPVWSDDIEEFAHRQYWSLRRDEIVVLLPDSAPAAAYANATAQALAELGIVTLAIESGECPMPDATHRLRVPGDRRTLPITQAVALQLLAYHLAIATGTDPDRRPHLKDDVEKFRVSRLLTRRSLLGTGT